MPEVSGSPLASAARPALRSTGRDTSRVNDSQRPQVNLPAPTLPKGGGAIRGLGEKVATSPSGALTISIPLPLPAGRSGFASQMELAYDSTAGNGPLGVGWNLSVASVFRKTERGIPRYLVDDTDTFVLSGGDDLIPVAPTPGRERVTEAGRTYRIARYRPRVEDAFSRIEQWHDTESGDSHWLVTTAGNVAHRFGARADSRVADPSDTGRVFRWLLEESVDAHGNRVLYEYKPEDRSGLDAASVQEHNRGPDAQRYLKAVRYGNTPAATGGSFRFLVVLDYGEHDLGAAAVRPWPVRADCFSSFRSGFEIRTRRLCRRVLVFHDFPELGEEPTLVRSLDLAYDERPALSHMSSITETGYERSPDGPYRSRSLPPFELGYTEARMGDAVLEVDADSLEQIPGGVDGTISQWVDLDDEGLPGVLTADAASWRYAPNQGGGRLGPSRLVATLPAPAATATTSTATRPVIVDLAGDGMRSLVRWDGPLPGFSERGPDGEWGPHTPFRSMPNIDWSDPQLRLLDVDGDGVADLVISQDGVFAVHRSLGREGFAERESASMPSDDERGPRVVFADGTETIFVADMNGDGLADLARITDGETVYWPNAGYGRFGPKVIMEGAPLFERPEGFRPDRLRLADIDGTGTLDLLYLGRDGVRFWSNHAGNSWSPARQVTAFPETDPLQTVAVVDLLGTGTSCLVWSSPAPRDRTRPLRYVDLVGEKPHLLSSLVNNLGAETEVHYAPSTRFYLEDRAAGVEWATRLPFPVQLVERIETLEAVTKNRLVSSYRYHHGYYDGPEREFRGFGLVEQQDAETFDASATGARDLPPVLARTWYNTGAYLEGETLVERYRQEFFADGDLDLGPPLIFEPDPEEWSVEDVREAHRALSGGVLRHEVFALDGSDLAAVPYQVTATTYVARRLQAAGDVPGVFLTHPSVEMTAAYERVASDPRVTQTAALEVDDRGNLRRSASVGLPRRTPQRPEQARPLVTLTESSFFDGDLAALWYRTGVLVSSEAFELSGLPERSRPFTAQELRDLAAAASDLALEDQPGDGTLQRRPVSGERHRYWRDDLSGPRPDGEVGALALCHRSYRLAMTAGLVTAAYGSRVGPDLLEGAGYVDLDGDGSWWAPSDLLLPDATRFYLPAAAESPFGHRGRVEYDRDALLVAESFDALDNHTVFTNDYRTLSPASVTDPNGNLSGVCFDELGRVIAIAVGGKPGSGEGQTLDRPSQTFAYDLDRWRQRRLPAVVHQRERETDDPGSRWQDFYSYSDGCGMVVQTKARAKPGPLGDGTSAAPRWVGSGRTVFDNKGNPVKQYEPYFSATEEYETDDSLVAGGVAVAMRYDPLGRRVQVDAPDGTFSRVEFDAWRQVSSDPNDTVLESSWLSRMQSGSPQQRRSAELAAAHANTPLVHHLDPLGRVVAQVADNGPLGSFETHMVLAISGDLLAVVDPNQVVCERTRYDALGRPVLSRSTDSGLRWSVFDVKGLPVVTADGREVLTRTQYDELRRPTNLFVRDGAGPERLAERTLYGEGHPEAVQRNLRGRLHQQYSQAGVVIHDGFDWKGNLVMSLHQLCADHRTDPDWAVLAELVQPDRLLNAAASLLDPESFSFTTTHDALSRPVSASTPDRSRTLFTYGEGGLLDRVEVELRGSGQRTTFVESIDYDASGQRELRVLGSGVQSRYEHDPQSFRLSRTLTTRGPTVLQDLRYTYDAVGNVTDVGDDVQQPVCFDNALALPGASFSYDAVYRLTTAGGREHVAAAGAASDDRDYWRSVPDTRDGSKLVRYTETYAYDLAGNLLSIQHAQQSQRASGGWQRRYAYASQSNRLSGTSLPGDPQGQFSAQYAHDDAGNVVRMPHLPSLDWDHAGRLRGADLGGGGRMYFAYDSGGRRVRKAVDSGGGQVIEQISLGVYEVFRRRSSGGVVSERESLHVEADADRTVLVETTTREDAAAVATPSPLIRYQYRDQLASVCLETNGSGQVISYEEYHPFGSTAYQAPCGDLEASPKRYRFTGKERDERTGFTYHGARYYAPWLGRWVSPDSAGMADGTNLYAYARNNPVTLADPTGMAADDDVKVEDVPGARVFTFAPLEFRAPRAPPPPQQAAPSPAERESAADAQAWREAERQGYTTEAVEGLLSRRTGLKGSTYLWRGIVFGAAGAYHVQRGNRVRGRFLQGVAALDVIYGQALFGENLRQTASKIGQAIIIAAIFRRLAAPRLAGPTALGLPRLAAAGRGGPAAPPAPPAGGGGTGGGAGGGGGRPVSPAVEPHFGGYRAYFARDPNALVAFEPLGPGVRVTDIYRGAQPSGSGGVMLAESLQRVGLPRPEFIRFSNVVNDLTRTQLASGLSPGSTLLGGTMNTAVGALGGRIASWRVWTDGLGKIQMEAAIRY